MDFILSIATIILLWMAIVWVLRKFHVSNINEKHVLITGCDTGFGNMLAKRLDKRGFVVIAACLHEDSLAELTSSCSKRLYAVQMDIREKEDIQRTLELVKQRLPPCRGLWALVNNAGVSGAYVPFDWMNQEEWNRVLQVNFFGLVNMTTIFASLIKIEKGRVVNMGSITGRIVLGGCGYSTSKFAVEGFTDCLRAQLRTFGVTTCLIEPGFFKTRLMDGIAAKQEHIWQNLPDNIKAEYGQQYYDKMVELVQAATVRIKEERSSMVVDAMEHSVSCWWPKSRYVVGWEAWFFFRILSFFPAGLTDIIMLLLVNQLKPQIEKAD